MSTSSETKSTKTAQPLTIVKHDEIKDPGTQGPKEPEVQKVTDGGLKTEDGKKDTKDNHQSSVLNPPSNSTYARGIQRTMDGVDYALERRLPTKGQVYAKLQDEVRPETIIAETKVTAGLRVFKLGELLGVAPHKAKKYLHRTIGARVYQGDVIAEAPKLLGLRSIQFLAPVDGILKDFNSDTGQLTLEFAPTSLRLPAGVKGKVSQIVPNEAVYIETKTSLLFGAFVAGKMREGALKIVAPPDQPIPAQAIDASLAGHIIAGGSLVNQDVINRCLAVGVKGVVSGGIAAHDLLAISGQPNSTEDVGLTLLIISGLGNSAIEPSTYQFLQRYQEQQVFIVPQERMMVAALPSDSTVTTKPAAKPVEYLPLKVGDSVRVLSSARAGQIAKVTSIVPPLNSQFSRLQIAGCVLELADGQSLEMPVTNVEIVAS